MTGTSTRLTRTALTLTSLSLLASLVGCGQQDDPSEVQGSESPSAEAGQAAASSAQPSASGNEPSMASSWQCPSNPGEAPSGTLRAERIAGSASERPGLYEGPVWVDGSLYFSDFTFDEGFPSRVQRLTDEGTLETAIEDSGSNGLAVDTEGFLMAATHDAKAISRYELSTGDREIVWDTYQDNRFNSPNDLTLTGNGIIYFTDPDFQQSAAPGRQPKTRVYRIGTDGISVVDDTIANPNGVSLSPDERTLYVAGGGEKGVLRAYDLDDQGQVTGHRDLAKVSVPDGMAIDCLGNIYVTEHSLQRLRVLSPEGEQLAEIKVDANITNAAFGGEQRKTLYLTGAGTLWQIELDVAGYPY
ncbi:SMP-30/gluconolactonase/LRE family protein [Marinimicrobium sp. ARAG 43.8]|uniref:SMP-30/gluconolactonase/LRE family protein n=1 Tax=Marinimicrobium sp. ARAG 43.8 TaxID=3418719 RepID=UPI003CEE7FAE